MSEVSLQIEHYVNKSENTSLDSTEEYFPVEVRINLDGKIINIRSKIAEYCQLYRGDIKKITNNHHKSIKYILQGYFTEQFFKRIYSQKLFPVFDLLMDEINVVSKIIHFNHPFDIKNFSPLNFTKEYVKHTTDIAFILDDSIRRLYLNEIKGLFVKSIDPKKSKEVFKISNYFIHFINWDNSFSSFYEITYEIMPSEIRLLENYFSPEFKSLIKAYMAFQSQVNIIRRTFEKKNPGKISTLSYFEWEADIREFLTQKFEKIFGQKKTEEYIDGLNKVISEYISKSDLRS